MSYRDQVRPMERTNLVVSAGVVAASAALGSPPFALGVGIGAALEALNFRGLAMGSMRLFHGDDAARPVWTAVFGLRFFMLAMALWVAIRTGADPVGLALGLSIIMPASIVGAWKVRPLPDPDAPSVPPDDPSWDLWDPWLARWREARPDEDETAA